MDWNGIATLVGAVAGGIISIGTFAMTVINWLDNRRQRKEQETHKKMLSAISKQVGADADASMDH